MNNTLYEIVKQDDNNYTIFKGNDQYCDDDGNPIRYTSYEEAKEDLDILNDTEEEIQYNKIQIQFEEI